MLLLTSLLPSMIKSINQNPSCEGKELNYEKFNSRGRLPSLKHTMSYSFLAIIISLYA
nr:MAG TPA: hypothetical protein [Caudoviricetes sp.]